MIWKILPFGLGLILLACVIASRPGASNGEPAVRKARPAAVRPAAPAPSPSGEERRSVGAAAPAPALPTSVAPRRSPPAPVRVSLHRGSSVYTFYDLESAMVCSRPGDTIVTEGVNLPKDLRVPEGVTLRTGLRLGVVGSKGEIYVSWDRAQAIAARQELAVADYETALGIITTVSYGVNEESPVRAYSATYIPY